MRGVSESLLRARPARERRREARWPNRDPRPRGPRQRRGALPSNPARSRDRATPGPPRPTATLPEHDPPPAPPEKRPHAPGPPPQKGGERRVPPARRGPPPPDE